MPSLDRTAADSSKQDAGIELLSAENQTHLPIADDPESTKDAGEPLGLVHLGKWLSVLTGGHQITHVVITLGTTVSIFLIYLIQGILTARVLGPVGRGEFNTAIFFPRDILLYVGLMGGIEIINRNASLGLYGTRQLKQVAARLGLVSGTLTALIAAILSTVVLLLVNNGEKAYLIPWCLLVCLFVPWEHIHLTVSGVDRGREDYLRYNWNRFCFAAVFPILILLLVVTGLHRQPGPVLLAVVCVLFVVSRIVGLLPTMRGICWRDWFRRPELNPLDKIPAPSTLSLLRDGRPYALSMLATELFERLDILLIVALASVEQSGFYFVAIPAATLLTIAPNALGVFTFNAGAGGRPITLGGALSLLLSIAGFQIAATFCLALIVPQLIVSLYGPEFGPSTEFVWYLLPACAIKGFLQAVDGYLKGCGKPMIGVGARSVSIVVMLAFVYLVYPQHGLLSIPMAAVAGQLVSMLIITSFAIGEVIRRQQGRRNGRQE